jgi:general secretion pathway protein D
VNVLATPLLLASNNRPARLFVGEERVLTTGVSTDVTTPSDGATTTTIDPETEVRDIGNSLLITPKINADRTVTLFLVHDSSHVSPDSATIPVATADGGVVPFPIDTVNTANLQATVVAKDGMTLAVGGLIRIELTDHEQKVPVLGDIPILRFFFRKKVTDRSKAELILLITPRVLFTPTEADAVTRERVKALSSHPYPDEGDASYGDRVEKLEKDNEKSTRGKGAGEGGQKE